MTARTAVRTQALRELVDRLSAAARTLRSGSAVTVTAAAAGAGDPALAAALHRFGTAADRARVELDDDLARTADSLRLVADAYDEVERQSAHRFGLWGWLGR